MVLNRDQLFSCLKNQNLFSENEILYRLNGLKDEWFSTTSVSEACRIWESCARVGSVKVAEKLHKLKLPFMTRQTCGVYAAKLAHFDIFKKFVEFGLNLNCEIGFNFFNRVTMGTRGNYLPGPVSALVVVSIMGHLDMVRFIISKLNNAHFSTTVQIEDAFVYACWNQKMEVCKYFLSECQVDVNTTDQFYKSTALMYAAQNGDRNMVDFLLANGADVTRKNVKEGKTAADYCFESDAGLKKYLQERTWNSKTLEQFWNETVERYPEDFILSLIRMSKIPIDKTSSCLHFACQKGYLQVVQELLRLGMNPSGPIREYKTWTPLQVSCTYREYEIAKTLLSFSHDHPLEQDDIDKALRLAVDNNDSSMVQLLLEHGASPNSQYSPNGNWKFQYSSDTIFEMLCNAPNVRFNTSALVRLRKIEEPKYGKYVAITSNGDRIYFEGGTNLLTCVGAKGKRVLTL
jgi:ankyrin repeat protein